MCVCVFFFYNLVTILYHIPLFSGRQRTFCQNLQNPSLHIPDTEMKNVKTKSNPIQLLVAQFNTEVLQEIYCTFVVHHIIRRSYSLPGVDTDFCIRWVPKKLPLPLDLKITFCKEWECPQTYHLYTQLAAITFLKYFFLSWQ